MDTRTFRSAVVVSASTVPPERFSQSANALSSTTATSP
jgi:hypothetical protein